MSYKIIWLILLATASIVGSYAPHAEAVLECAIPGQSEPLGYNIWSPEPYGFVWPADTKWSTLYWYETAQGRKLVMTATSASTPMLIYVLPFSDLSYSCDAQGQHCGEHPCGAFAVAREAWAQHRQDIERGGSYDSGL